jgi:two-component system sensor histidine kinase MtrB
VLAVGIGAGALALGSYFLVRQTRLDDSLDQAETQARANLLAAAGMSPSTPDPQRFVRQYEQRGVHAVLLVARRRYASDARINPRIPADLRRLAADGQLGFERFDVGASPHLVIGGRPPRSDAELYFFFPESRIHDDLLDLRNVLLAGWVVVVLIAGLTGRALARRVLEPVAKASEAARSMASGALDTRLPADTRDEFGAWAASFNEMADTLEAKITALSEAEARERRFTADVAHELRTPLAALVGEASMLREHLDRMPEETRRPAELLVQDVGRLRRLVDDLMEISRLDAGHEIAHVERVDLSALTSSAIRVRHWQEQVEQSGDDAVVAMTDPRRAERILVNLVGNAIAHGGRGVRVRVGRDPGWVLVEVSDEGPGIAPEHLPHLFERFYKADPARSSSQPVTAETSGSGLGLAIAMENTKLLGGELEVSSKLGVGTRFLLRLPDQAQVV